MDALELRQYLSNLDHIFQIEVGWTWESAEPYIFECRGERKARIASEATVLPWPTKFGWLRFAEFIRVLSAVWGVLVLEYLKIFSIQKIHVITQAGNKKYKKPQNA